MQETAPQGAPWAPTPRADTGPDPRRWWILAVLSLALFVIILNNGLLNVALPQLMRDLGTGVRGTQWIVDGYALVFAASLLTAGTLSDRYGRKRATLLGAALFGAASLVAITASGAGQLIAARAVMGLAAAFVMPGTLSILVDVFPKEERAWAIGVWGSTSALGVAAGPIVGGALVSHYWWGSVFLVNLLPVVVVLVAGALLLPESSDPTPRRSDPVGALLGATAMASLVYGAIHAAGDGWTSAPVLAALACAAGAAAVFVRWERRHPSPVVDFALLRKPAFLGAGAGNMLLFMGLAGTLFVLTQRLQFAMGYGPLKAGLAVAPLALAVGAGSALSPGLARRAGARGAVSAGLLVCSAGVLALAELPGGYLSVLTGLVLAGTGVGLALAPVTDTVMGLVPARRSGNAAALNDTLQELGNALGVAVVGTVLARGLGGAGHASAHDPAVRGALDGASGSAFRVAACVVAVGAVLAAFLLPGPHGDGTGGIRAAEPPEDRSDDRPDDRAAPARGGA
ncbi:MFS transporter [Streptomyces sp. Je 1-332]|uniref:MFS transporter n=1 Tax=Streptomyces sp. Je 1-332 TaxID=3231270 RepID=UPI00345A8E50